LENNVEDPIVKIFHHGIRRTRTGRGFSKAELVQVGILNVYTAASKGIHLDKWRKTLHPENVERLTKFLSYQKANRKKTRKKLPIKRSLKNPKRVGALPK
jgi:ribosomal protein L13E